MPKTSLLMYAAILGCSCKAPQAIAQAPQEFSRSGPNVVAIDQRLRANLYFGVPITASLTLNSGLDKLGLIEYVNDGGANQGIWYRDKIGGINQWVKFGTATYAFNANDFSASGVNVALKYSTMQAVNGSVNGIVTPTLYNTWNGKQNALPSQTGHNGQFLTTNGSALSWAAVSGTGTVTSIGMIVPSGFSVAPSSINTNGTFDVTTALNGLVYGTGSGFAVSAINSPINFSAGTLSIQVATDLQAGYLSAADHATFLAKQPAATGAVTTVMNANLPANHIVISDGSGKISSLAALGIAQGGTNSSTTLNNNRIVKSSGGAIVEAAAITPSRLLISDANGIPTHSATTSTEAGYLSGVTSAIQTQINGKEPTITYAVQTLTDGPTITWNTSSGYNAKVTLGGNRTLSLSGFAAGHSGTIIFIQDNTGSRNITLPAGSKVLFGQGSGTTLQLSQTANYIDIANVFYDGTTYYWTLGKNFQ